MEVSLNQLKEMERYVPSINEWKNFFLVYKFALEEMTTKINILKEEFQMMHDYNPIEHVKSRLKSPDSVIKKLERKGLALSTENAKKHIHDIAGIRITCSFAPDIYLIYEMLKKHDDLKVLKVKDYVANPKKNGYKSLHFIAEIPVFLTSKTEYVQVEIQIRTIAMDFWASLEHKIYYKFNEDIPAKLLHELKEAADIVGYLDRKMEKINNEMEVYKDLKSIKSEKL